jgi:hypothetical protein
MNVRNQNAKCNCRGKAEPKMSYIKGESKIPRASQAKDKFQYIPLGEGGSCKGAQETRENFTRRPESAASGVDKSFSSVLPSFL